MTTDPNSTQVPKYGSSKKGKYGTYPEMETTDINWIDQIPKLWKSTKLRNIFDIKNGSTPKSSEDTYWGGDIEWATPEDLQDENKCLISETKRQITEDGLDACGATLVPRGSILLSTRAPIGHVGVADVPITTNQGCKSLVFKSEDHNEMYFYYLLRASEQELKSLGSGSTYDELNTRHLKEIRLPVPSEKEQKEISQFLDKEVGEIKELTEQKLKLVSLLEEKKSALITKAVTRGFDSDVQLVNTDFDWIEDIPAGWNVSRLKRWLDRPITDGPHETPEYVDDGIPFLSADAVRDGELDFSREQGQISEDLHKEYSRKISPGKHDILFVKSGATTGKVAIVSTEQEFSIWSPLAVLRANRELINPRFLYYALKSTYVQEQIKRSWSAGTQENLAMGDLERIYIIAPQPTQQEKIVEELEENTEIIDELVRTVEEGIELLKEYRTALIIKTVTGQIDVRGEM